MDTNRISRNRALAWVVNLDRKSIVQWDCREEQHEKTESRWRRSSGRQRKYCSNPHKEQLWQELLEYVVNREDASFCQDCQRDCPKSLTIVIKSGSEHVHYIQFRLHYKEAK